MTELKRLRLEPGWLAKALAENAVVAEAYRLAQADHHKVVEAVRIYDAIRQAFPGQSVLEVSLPHADNPSPTIYPLIFKS